VTEAMHRRVRAIEQRTNLRRWEYRQREHARGVWFLLRRLLADAQEAFVLDAADAGRVIEMGFEPEPVGARLAPPLTLVFAPRAAVASLPSARRVPVRLSTELLSAPCVALVRFGE
jgi:hypothetical protein